MGTSSISLPKGNILYIYSEDSSAVARRTNIHRAMNGQPSAMDGRTSGDGGRIHIGDFNKYNTMVKFSYQGLEDYEKWRTYNEATHSE